MFFLYTRRALILFISFLSITLTKTTKSKSKLTDRVKIQFLIWSDFRQILQSCPLGSHNVYLGKKIWNKWCQRKTYFCMLLRYTNSPKLHPKILATRCGPHLPNFPLSQSNLTTSATKQAAGDILFPTSSFSFKFCYPDTEAGWSILNWFGLVRSNGYGYGEA